MSRSLKNKQKSPSSTARELDPALIETAPQAFAKLRTEIEAVPIDQLVRIFVDIPRAARCGLVAAENVAPLLPELAELRQLDVRPVRMLGLYSLALLHAHDVAIEGDSDQPSLSALVTEASRVREGLLRTAELLAHYGLVSVDRVATIRRGHGHADLADGVLALGRMFVDVWPRVHDKVVAKREEVDRALVLSAQLQKALGIHEAEQSPLTRHTGRRHVRSQAFTLFYRAYQETRRGVTFLRWYEDDVQGIVPSLRPRLVRRAGAQELAAEVDLPLVPPSMAAMSDVAASA